METSSENTKKLYNICTMWTKRRRRWPSVVQMLYKRFVFAGSVPLEILVGVRILVLVIFVVVVAVIVIAVVVVVVVAVAAAVLGAVD